MRALGPFAAIAVTLSVVGATAAQAGGQQNLVIGAASPDRISGQYVVELDATTPVASALTEARRAYGAASVDHVYRSAIHGYSAHMTPAEAQRLARAPGVRAVHADTRFHTTVQSLPTGINRANADASPTAAINRRDRRVNVDVAVIDTGVAMKHPDLHVFRRGAKDCSSVGVGAGDRNGHGTHVAGTIGALDNRTGVVGMAPGARIWPVRVLGPDGSAGLADIICGIDFVTRHAAAVEVANLSLGGPGRDDGNCGRTNGDVLHQAICASVAAGVTYVVAAGNDAQDAALFTPASYDEVITVSALADFNGRPAGGARTTCIPAGADVDDTLANFSNFGRDVDVIAPGVCIRSTWLAGGFMTLSGTSMATPHVTGAAALFLARHPAATPSAVKNALESAGTALWNAVDDPDGTKEPLLNVSGF